MWWYVSFLLLFSWSCFLFCISSCSFLCDLSCVVSCVYCPQRFLLSRNHILTWCHTYPGVSRLAATMGFIPIQTAALDRGSGQTWCSHTMVTGKPSAPLPRSTASQTMLEELEFQPQVRCIITQQVPEDEICVVTQISASRSIGMLPLLSH